MRATVVFIIFVVEVTKLVAVSKEAFIDCHGFGGRTFIITLR